MICLVVLNEAVWIHLLEFVDLLFVYDNKDSGEKLSSMRVCEVMGCHFLLVDQVSQVFRQIAWAILLLESVQLVFDIRLLFQLLLELVIASLLSGHNLCSDHFERLVNWELRCVPLEVLDILLNGLCLFFATPLLFFDDKLCLLVEFLGRTHIYLFTSFDGGLHCSVQLAELIHELHQMIQRPNFELFFVDLRNKI